MSLHSYSLRKLDGSHEVNEFDCGADQQNKFLLRALGEQESGANTTHVLSPRGEPTSVAGFFCLSPGSRNRAEAPKAFRKGLPNIYPQLGYVHLGQMARDKHTADGFGQLVMISAQLVTLEVADLVGGAALTLWAGNETLAGYYETTYGFTRFSDSLECYLRLDDLSESLPHGTDWREELAQLRAPD